MFDRVLNCSLCVLSQLGYTVIAFLRSRFENIQEMDFLYTRYGLILIWIYSRHLVDPFDLSLLMKNNLNHEYTSHLDIRYLNIPFQKSYHYFSLDLPGNLKIDHYVNHTLIES